MAHERPPNEACKTPLEAHFLRDDGICGDALVVWRVLATIESAQVVANAHMSSRREYCVGLQTGTLRSTQLQTQLVRSCHEHDDDGMQVVKLAKARD